MKRTLFLFCSLLLVSSNLFSQTTNEGTDFWFGFMENNGNPTSPVRLKVYVTAREAAVINLTSPQNNLNREVSVAANSTELISIPTAYMPTIEGKSATGLHLTSDVSVSVYVLNERDFSADASVIFPTNVLENEYWVLAHAEPEGDIIEGSEESELLVVATEDNTSIEITPSAVTFEGWQPGITQTIVLNAGETYQLKSDDDLTGTHVKTVDSSASCAPLAVFGGNKFTNVGGCGGNRDHLVEQMSPSSRWGKEYLYVPFRTRNNGDYVKIMASEDGTTVNVEQEGSTVLNAGEWTVYKALPGVREISANKPIMVGQFSRSTMCDGVDASDPFMIILSPLQQRLNQVSFNTLKTGNVFNYYLTLVTTVDGFNGITLDGNDIGPEFYAMSGMRHAYATMEVSNGEHQIEAPNGVIVYAYGFGFNESFGFSAGLGLNDLSLAIFAGTEDEGIESLEACPGALLSLEALSASLNDPEGFSNFVWNLGDGTTKEGQMIEHSYSESGEYTITLRAERDSEQCGSSEPVVITRTALVTDLSPGDIIGQASVCPDVTAIEYWVVGNADYSYEWSITGGTISSSSISPSVLVDWGAANENASLSVMISDNEGCMVQKQLAVKINKRLEPSLPQGPEGLCFDRFSNMQYWVPPTNGSQYEWFVEGGTIISGSNGSSVSVDWDGPNTPGRIWYREYNPAISDCEGFSEKLEITIYPELEGTVTTTDVLCFGESNGMASFEFSGGKPGDYKVRYGADEIVGTVLTGLEPGNYSVDILDALDCIKQVNFSIFEPAALSMELEKTDVLCFEEANGTITANPMGGTAPYSYSIGTSEFQDSPDFTGLSAGDYSVTVQDANECTFSSTISMGQPGLLELAITMVEGNTIRVEATGGTPGYEYSIDGVNFQSSPDFTINTGGEYTVIVRDANACTSSITSSFTITSVELPAGAAAISTYPNPTRDQLVISSVQAGDAIVLFDLKGNVMREVTVKANEENYPLSLANITESILLLRVTDKQGRQKLTQKVIIKD